MSQAEYLKSVSQSLSNIDEAITVIAFCVFAICFCKLVNAVWKWIWSKEK